MHLVSENNWDISSEKCSASTIQWITNIHHRLSVDSDSPNINSIGFGN
jgi:hypothetical protein